MKYKILTIAALIFLMAPATSWAFPVKYDMMHSDIVKYCYPNPTIACYYPSLKIILMDSEKTRGQDYIDIYYHEVGHYYLQGQDYSAFLHKGWWGDETMADGFSLWIQGKMTKPSLAKVSEFYARVYEEVNLRDGNDEITVMTEHP
ncbi:MAG: hypothetical protein WC069_05855 [Candidatus Shapirobacteria bacterium]